MARTSKKQKKGSGDPRKKALALSQPPVRRVTSAKSWRREVHIELDLPSGNTCLVRRPGLPELLASGVFPDDVMAIVQESLDLAKARLLGRPVEMDVDAMAQQVMDDPKRLAAMLEAFDRATVYSVVEPPVRYHLDREGRQIPFTDRDPEVLYTDQIDSEDKIHIFNFVCGGTSDVNRFRQEHAAAMADVSNGEDVQATP